MRPSGWPMPGRRRGMRRRRAAAAGRGGVGGSGGRRRARGAGRGWRPARRRRRGRGRAGARPKAAAMASELANQSSSKPLGLALQAAGFAGAREAPIARPYRQGHSASLKHVAPRIRRTLEAPGRVPYLSGRAIRTRTSDDRRGSSGRIPRRRRAARGPFHPLLGPAQPALPAMRAGADGPGARRAAGRARSPPRCPRELRDRDRHRRLAGDGRRHHRPRNGPRARRRGDLRRAARRARSSCAAASGSSPGEQVLLVEDVVTTGLSSREAIAAIEAAGGEVDRRRRLVDRSGGTRRSRRALHPADPDRRARPMTPTTLPARARRHPRR